MSDKITAITDERGSNYGHPSKHFLCTQTMYAAWLRCRSVSKHPLDHETDLAINHGVYMVLDKLARMAENPNHRDNIDDIQGYAKCIGMVLDKPYAN